MLLNNQSVNQSITHCRPFTAIWLEEAMAADDLIEAIRSARLGLAKTVAE